MAFNKCGNKASSFTWDNKTGERFRSWVKERFFEQVRRHEVPDSRALAPGAEEIKEFVCRDYGIEQEDLLRSRRGVFNEPRNVAMYLIRGLRGEGLDALCREFHMKRYSSASSALERVRLQMLKDRYFRKASAKPRSVLDQTSNGDLTPFTFNVLSQPHCFCSAFTFPLPYEKPWSFEALGGFGSWGFGLLSLITRPEKKGQFRACDVLRVGAKLSDRRKRGLRVYRATTASLVPHADAHR